MISNSLGNSSDDLFIKVARQQHLDTASSVLLFEDRCQLRGSLFELLNGFGRFRRNYFAINSAFFCRNISVERAGSQRRFEDGSETSTYHPCSKCEFRRGGSLSSLQAPQHIRKPV